MMPLPEVLAPRLAPFSFQPKIRLTIERFPYLAKTAESAEELKSVLALRANVFKKRALWIGNGFDQLDLLCDHLAVFDQRSGECVGTYRLISSSFSDNFYSAGEFDLTEFLKRPGVKLELGRACISKDHRHGAVFALLWKGITHYMQHLKAAYLFGCSSIQTTDPWSAEQIRRFLQARGYVDPEMRIPPHQACRLESPQYLESSPARGIGGLIPPLLTWYLSEGARVGPDPAIDRDAHCIDFITVMKTDRLTESFKRKFSD